MRRNHCELVGADSLDTKRGARANPAMGDDPYDFEIAIPAAGGGGGGKAQSYSSRRQYGDDSGDDSSDVSISASDEDEEDESAESVEAAKPKPKAAQQQPQLSARGGGAGVTSSSSSALDKAKNFLSKYSTKAVDTKGSKPAASARSSRRVELSLDDSMDFSPDEDSDDDDEKSKSKRTQGKQLAKAAVATASAAKRVSLSDSEDYGLNSDDERRKRQQHAATKMPQRSAQLLLSTQAKQSDSESSGGGDNDKHRSRTGTPALPANKPSAQSVAATKQRSVDDDSVGEGEDDDAVASFMDESDEGAPPPFSASATKIEPKPTTSQLSAPQPTLKNKSDKVESEEEEEEEDIASTSDYIESFGDENFPVMTKPSAAVAPAAAPAAPASESGAYEEEDFDDESGVAPSSPACITSAAQSSGRLEDSAKIEPTFDYSMDFSDDGKNTDDIKQTTAAVLAVSSVSEAPARLAACEEDARSSSSRSDEGDRRSEHSDLLGSDGSGGDDDDANSEPSRQVELPRDPADEGTRAMSPHLRDQSDSGIVIADAAAAASRLTVDAAPHTRFAEDLREAKPQCESVAAAAVEHADAATRLEIPFAAACDTSKARSEPLQRALPVPAASVARSRILIVREYELPDRGQTEMKDASTQFTGNHAAIQADLTPDGMHSVAVDSPPRLPEESLPVPPMQHVSASQPSEQNPIRDHSNRPLGERPHPAVAAAPPPPVPILPPPAYSMDALRLPSATTTSIYKQQLLALQEQILVKKRETERLVQERMAFQYSTLRGTERFLSSNRPGKLELWQALMRVDPTLTERKAREVAQLTTEKAAA